MPFQVIAFASVRRMWRATINIASLSPPKRQVLRPQGDVAAPPTSCRARPRKRAARAHRPERGRHRLFAYLRLSRETDRQTKKARPDEDDSAFDAESRIGPASMPACCGAATTNFETSYKKKRRSRHGIMAGAWLSHASTELLWKPQRRGEGRGKGGSSQPLSDLFRSNTPLTIVINEHDNSLSFRVL